MAAQPRTDSKPYPQFSRGGLSACHGNPVNLIWADASPMPAGQPPAKRTASDTALPLRSGISPRDHVAAAWSGVRGRAGQPRLACLALELGEACRRLRERSCSADSELRGDTPSINRSQLEQSRPFKCSLDPLKTALGTILKSIRVNQGDNRTRHPACNVLQRGDRDPLFAG